MINVTELTDHALLTKARDTLASDDIMLIEGNWGNINGCCTLGAATVPWEPISGGLRAWKHDVRKRVAVLLVPHIDRALVDTVRRSGQLRIENHELILDASVDPLHRITAYSDYVLYPRMDGKRLAIELYDRAIAALTKEPAHA